MIKKIGWILILFVSSIGCADNRRGPDLDPGNSSTPNWTVVGAQTKIPIDYELEARNADDPIGETVFTVTLINQKIEQATITCTIYQAGSNRKNSYKITVPGNGRIEFKGDYDDTFENLIYPGDTVVVSSNFYNEKIDIKIPGKRKPRPPVPIEWSIAKTFYVTKDNQLQEQVGCEISLSNPTLKDLKVTLQSYRKSSPVILGEEQIVCSKDRILLIPKTHEENDCIIAGDRIIVSAPRYSPIELRVPQDIKVETIEDGLKPPKPAELPVEEIPIKPQLELPKNDQGKELQPVEKNKPEKIAPGNPLNALRGLTPVLPGLKDDEFPPLKKDGNGRIIIPEDLRKGKKYLGNAGQAIGLDSNQMPVEIPWLPADYMSVTSVEGRSILSNAKYYWLCYHEFWRLRDIYRYCEIHGLPPEGIMSFKDLQMWNKLNSPGLRTASGKSIFQAPIPNTDE
jgi:hypothetical protein